MPPSAGIAARDVPRGEDVISSACATELVYEDPVVDLEPGGLAEIGDGNDPEAGDDRVGLDRLSLLRRHDA